MFCTDAAKTEFASLLGIEDATAMEVVETDTAAEAAAAAAAAKGDADAADDWPSGSLVWHKNPNGTDDDDQNGEEAEQVKGEVARSDHSGSCD